MMIKKDRYFTSGELCKRLNVSYGRLRHLFNSNKLKKEEFLVLSNGDIAYTEADIDRIKELLFK